MAISAVAYTASKGCESEIPTPQRFSFRIIIIILFEPFYSTLNQIKSFLKLIFVKSGIDSSCAVKQFSLKKATIFSRSHTQCVDLSYENIAFTCTASVAVDIQYYRQINSSEDSKEINASFRTW